MYVNNSIKLIDSDNIIVNNSIRNTKLTIEQLKTNALYE